MTEQPDERRVERRRVNRDLEDSVIELSATVRELRAVYNGDLALQRQQMAVIERDVKANLAVVEKLEERRGAMMKLVITAIAIPIFLIIFQLYLATQIGPR